MWWRWREGGKTLQISVISAKSVLLLGNHTAALLVLWTAGDGSFCKSMAFIYTSSSATFLSPVILEFRTSCRQLHFAHIQVFRMWPVQALYSAAPPPKKCVTVHTHTHTRDPREGNTSLEFFTKLNVLCSDGS